MFERLESQIKGICQQNAVGLYDIDVINAKNGKVLCVYITKIGGVNVTDCSNVSKGINSLVETDKTLIDNLVNIEVSSPGLERTLKFKKHYINSINETIKISYSSDEKKETIIGTLTEINPDHIVIKKENEKFAIAFQNIKKAKTFYQIKKSSNSNDKRKHSSKPAPMPLQSCDSTNKGDYNE